MAPSATRVNPTWTPSSLERQLAVYVPGDIKPGIYCGTRVHKDARPEICNYCFLYSLQSHVWQEPFCNPRRAVINAGVGQIAQKRLPSKDAPPEFAPAHRRDLPRGTALRNILMRTARERALPTTTITVASFAVLFIKEEEVRRIDFCSFRLYAISACECCACTLCTFAPEAPPIARQKTQSFPVSERISASAILMDADRPDRRQHHRHPAFINARRRIVQPMIDQSNRAGSPSFPFLCETGEEKWRGEPLTLADRSITTVTFFWKRRGPSGAYSPDGTMGYMMDGQQMMHRPPGDPAFHNQYAHYPAEYYGHHLPETISPILLLFFTLSAVTFLKKKIFKKYDAYKKIIQGCAVNAVFVSRTNNHSDDFVVPSLVTRLPGTSGRSTGRFRSARTSLAWLLLLLFCKKKRRSRTTPSVVPSKFGDKAERRSYFDRSKLIHPSPLSRTTSGVRAPPARAPPPIHDVYDFSDVIASEIILPELIPAEISSGRTERAPGH
ncbi:hypothetical protein GEV33_010948 [Tenebrio molitor]|uniref:Uncharacterized protein n=1 Tax=Tenebrio molitor TaxID=7067 RepID=A0A8J6HCF7_TENMO|nr:hypothetical protein GEV33_010948 [Tenebrio molitor]